MWCVYLCVGFMYMVCLCIWCIRECTWEVLWYTWVCVQSVCSVNIVCVVCLCMCGVCVSVRGILRPMTRGARLFRACQKARRGPQTPLSFWRKQGHKPQPFLDVRCRQ